MSWLSKEFGCSYFHCTTACKIQYLTKLDPIKEKPLPLSFVLNQSVRMDKKKNLPIFVLENSCTCLALWGNSGWHMPSHQPLRNMSMPCPHKLYVQNGSWRDQSWFLISLIISIKRTYSGEEVFLQLEHFNELWNEVQDRLDKILYILFIYTAFKIDYSNSIFPSKNG